MNGLRLPLIAGLLACTGARLPAAAPAEVVLGGPAVVKLDWNIRSLQAADLDRDGLTDLAVINNDHATIDLLYQLKPGVPRPDLKSDRPNRWEPVVEDARFRRVSVTTGITMFELAVGDLNGDGRPDLAYTGDPENLTIRYQQADGTWLEKKIPGAPAPIQYLSGLRIADLDGDGRNDLVMIGQKELAVFFQQKDGELGPPDRYALAEDNCFGLEICDVNGDGRPDLVYLSTGDRDIVHVRLQSANHQFGPELSYPIKSASSTLQILPPATPKGPPGFVYASNRTGQLEFFRLEPAAADKAAAPGLRPRVFTPFPGGKTAAAYAFGDFDGDGREDVAVSDPDSAQVYIYFRQPDGGFTVARRFPSLADARSLAAGDWEGNGHADLFVASPKEQVLGVSAVNADGRLGYPQPLPVKGRPLAVAAGDLRGDKHVSVVVLLEDKGDRSIAILQRNPDGTAKVTRSIPLTGLKTDPRSLRLIDANQDGLLDIAVFTPLDVMRLYVQAADGTFSDAAANPAFRKGLVDNLEAGALSVGDLNADGKSELLVSSGGFTRALKLDASGALVVVDQFNARDPSAEVDAAFVLPSAPGAHRPGVLLYDRKGEQFQRLQADAQGVYEVAEVTPAGKIDVVGTEARPGRAGAGPEIFLLGKNRFWWLPLGAPDLSVHPFETYTSDLPDVKYEDVLAGHLNADGQPEIVGIDPTLNLVEVLSRDPANKTLVSRLHFKVFEADEHYQGRKTSRAEPRESLIADVTGDGKDDLILLVHDRILIYPQQ